ncbi:MAG TPA: helix-turn-helix domain-containing protein [Puia sp.]
MAGFQPRPIEEVIIDTILDFRGHEREKVFSKSRKKELVHTRRLVSWFLRKKTTISLKRAGEIIGGKDHTTVIHHMHTLKDLMDTELCTRQEVSILTAMLS